MDGATAPRLRVMTDPAVPRIAEILRAHFGARLTKLVLYGSRARGDARPDSDYDLAAFLEGDANWAAEWDALVPVVWRIFDEVGVDVEVHAFPERDWSRRTPYMWHVREDGVEL